MSTAPEADEMKMRADNAVVTPGPDVGSALSALAERPSVDLALEAIREFLGMDVAYTSEIVGGEMTLRALDGDGTSFSLCEGMSSQSEMTPCHWILNGALPSVIPDARAEEQLVSLPITQAADIRAFTSVPLRFSDGRLYGTLCAASHQAMPSLGERELRFLQVVARIVTDQIERDEARTRTSELKSQASAAATLIAAVEARDSYTGEHSQAVVDHATAVATSLGLSASEIRDVAQVALLHDIGKLAVPDAILHKPGPLNDEEWVVMRTHPLSSERLIGNVPELAHLAPAIRSEHEHWDGGGYPDGLSGEAIPLSSRITLVCDAYHAMTSDRPYRPAMTAAQAQAEIVAGIGTQFCPVVARALLEVVQRALAVA